MPDLKPVSEKSGFDLLGRSKYMDNTAQFVKMWTEMAERGIQSENDLNNLKLSNLIRLGSLRQKQEKDVLDAALAANKKLIDQRTELMIKAVEEEEALDLKKLKAKIKAEDAERKKAGKAVLTAAEKKALEDKLKDEFKQRKKHIEEQAKWEQKNKKKELEQEAAETKRKKQKESREYAAQQASDAFGVFNGKSFAERKDALKNIFTGGGKVNADGTITSSKGANFAAGLSALSGALSNFAKQLETQMDEIASKKSAIDTRLQGSGNEKRMGSY